MLTKEFRTTIIESIIFGCKVAYLKSRKLNNNVANPRFFSILQACQITGRKTKYLMLLLLFSYKYFVGCLKDMVLTSEFPEYNMYLIIPEILRVRFYQLYRIIPKIA